MAADVTSLVRFMNGHKEEQLSMNESTAGAKSPVLMTRDLLGGCSTLDSKELDLDLQVPTGWEKRLDLTSGKVYLQRCNSPNTSASSSEQKNQNSQSHPKLQDLNFPPPSKQALNLFDDTTLDIKLVQSSSSTSPSSSNYHSVCTIDKVKSALERAEKEMVRKRSISMSKSSSPPSNSSSSIKESDSDYIEKSSPSFAAGCPNCLLYVLISRSNPRCPRCNMIIPMPVTTKKPRIDLNISMSN